MSNRGRHVPRTRTRNDSGFSDSSTSRGGQGANPNNGRPGHSRSTARGSSRNQHSRGDRAGPVISPAAINNVARVCKFNNFLTSPD